MATYKPYCKINAFFPPAPTFTDKNLPSLKGKVHIVTGAASGIGYELAKILYLAGGTVYIAARSTARCEGAIEKLLSETASVKNDDKGKLGTLVVDLGDLRTIKSGVESFLQKESRLDILMHNAGVMEPPAGSQDKLGHDLELGTNCLGPHLMTLLLEPILIRTATLPDTPKCSVRLVWVVSLLQGWSPPQGMRYEKDGTPLILKGVMENYMQSKVGAVWLSMDLANRLGKHGILSVSVHPGVVKTELQRHWPLPVRALISTIMKPSVYAAYSELYAAHSPDVKPEQNGGHLMAWGRPADMPPYIADGFRSKSEGGTGVAEKFFEYSNREIKDYL